MMPRMWTLKSDYVLNQYITPSKTSTEKYDRAQMYKVNEADVDAPP